MSANLLIAGFLSRIAAIPALYLIAWCLLAGLSVALVFSLRSRWGRRQPLYRCAVFSLVVHVVLVTMTMSVRLVVGDGGAGGTPIHVKLVDDIHQEGPITLAAPPPLLVEAAPEPEVEPAESQVAKVEEPLPAIEPPPLLTPPEPVAEEKAEEKIVLDEPVAVPPLEAIAEAETKPEPVEETPKIEPITPTPTEAVAITPPAHSSPVTEVVGTIPPATSPYAHRNAADRLQYAESHGGSLQTEASVNAALKWLAATQSEDGRWDASRYGAGHEMAVLGQDRGGAGADADSGITALAVLAFLGAGHTHQTGEYQPNVASGLEFLMRGQSADGHLANDVSLYARMYCHSMASFALAEALAMTGDKRLEPAVRRAVNYSLRAQHPSTGGWRYRPGDLGDTSQLGWQLMSLWSAERAGIEVPMQTWTGAERFLRSVRRGRVGGLASYRPDDGPSTPMTAEAMYCRHLVAEALKANPDLAANNEATAAILAVPPEPNRVNLYYWYYGTLALHHQQNASSESAAAWQTWNASLSHVLVNSQLTEGVEAGSWEPNCIWGGYGGRVYSTAIAAMCLEVYYRYTEEESPTNTQPGWTASRQDVRRLPR
jgi:hypothetical protein